jgi:alkylation response protein AidB-like acyl-CoA dehydrogenase
VSVFTPEQGALREMVRSLLAGPAAPVERAVGSFDRTLWMKLATLGLTGLAAGDDVAGLVEVALAVEEAGRALVAVPYLSTVVASAALGDSPRQRGISDGTTVATLAVAEPGAGWDLGRTGTVAVPAGAAYELTGVKEHVSDGDLADLVLVTAVDRGKLGLFAVVEPPRTGMSTMDHSRPVARLDLDRTPAERVGGADAAAYALDLLHTMAAVEAVGVAAASLELTVAHLRTRVQFGQPLATFQALRHRVADLAVALAAATSAAWHAVRTRDELPVAAPVAKLVAADAAYRITAESIQLHGGIGFTWEHPAHRYFKRATVTRLSYGDPIALRRLIGTRAGIS